MRVLIADELGFCFGVRRAIDLVEKAARKHGGVETLGAIVHNDRVVQSLNRLNISVVEDLSAAHGPVVAVTAHGAPPTLYAAAKDRALEIFDTTCPFVKKAQRAAHRLAEAGANVYVFGDPEHPEVKGILGWAGERAVAGRDWAPLCDLLPPRRKLGFVSQTTQAPEHFAAFVREALDGLEGFGELSVVNTICEATVARQTAVKKLAAAVELVLVVGSRTSANTRHLAELAATRGVPTYLVESSDDVQAGWLHGRRTIGLAAGASTPTILIAEVRERVIAQGDD